MTALGKEDEFSCDFFRSLRVDEKQSRNSILTEWIGMGRSGSQITAKRQLWDCVTLTMVLLSLLFRPGKRRFVNPCWSTRKSASRFPMENANIFSICCVSETNLFTSLWTFLTRHCKSCSLFCAFNKETCRCCSKVARPLRDKVGSCCCGVSQPPRQHGYRC